MSMKKYPSSGFFTRSMSLIKSLVDVGAGSRVVLMASAQSSSIDDGDKVRLVANVDCVDAKVGTSVAIVVTKSAGTVIPPGVSLLKSIQ
jgi:hypothetical protein